MSRSTSPIVTYPFQRYHCPFNEPHVMLVRVRTATTYWAPERNFQDIVEPPHSLIIMPPLQDEFDDLKMLIGITRMLLSTESFDLRP